MSNVISFPKAEPEEEYDPHLQGYAICIACRHEWMAVVPVGTVNIICPSCNLKRGQMLNPAEVDTGFILECNSCHSSHYQIICSMDKLPLGVVCVGCGSINNFIGTSEGPSAA